MYLGGNLKELRKRRKLSQEEVSQRLGFKRSSYSGYENGASEPNIENLILLADFFRISLDKVIRVDLSKLSEKEWERIDSGIEIDLKGTNLRVLATSVNQEDEENIELVSQKASAGYTSGFSDPDFIKVLPTFNLPFLSKQKKYRSFPIQGDSMPPVEDGSYVVAEYVENWNHIKNGHPYIVVTKDDGIVFKVVYKRLSTNKSFQLCSTNPLYEPYEVNVNEILEIWKFVNYISEEIPQVSFDNADLTKAVIKIQKDVSHMSNLFESKKLD
jgi:transcriptional regulator with XRE-family HTH domain